MILPKNSDVWESDLEASCTSNLLRSCTSLSSGWNLVKTFEHMLARAWTGPDRFRSTLAEEMPVSGLLNLFVTPFETFFSAVVARSEWEDVANYVWVTLEFNRRGSYGSKTKMFLGWTELIPFWKWSKIKARGPFEITNRHHRGKCCHEWKWSKGMPSKRAVFYRQTTRQAVCIARAEYLAKVVCLNGNQIPTDSW